MWFKLNINNIYSSGNNNDDDNDDHDDGFPGNTRKTGAVPQVKSPGFRRQTLGACTIV